jgi:maltokinase
MLSFPRRVRRLSSEALLGLIVEERWFASKAREPERAQVAGVHHAQEGLAVVLVDVAFPGGTHDMYALALGLDARGKPFDALRDPVLCRRLARLAGIETPVESLRSMSVEQSNSSVVLDERYVLKLYRRLDPGPNPELEVLRHFGARGFPNAPPLEGAVEHRGSPLEAALVVVTGFVPSAGGGWELALETLRSDPEWLPRRARRLGEVTGAMHAVLASDSGDSVFAPEEPSSEALAILAASIDEEIRVLFSDLPALPGLEPIAGRGEELREYLQRLAPAGRPGLFLRIHGDYHLGQVLWADHGDWVVIDFEGEPARGLPERRQRQSAMRDVAGMVRSFAYAAEALRLLHGRQAPPDWDAWCRSEFLAGYRDTVDERLLPGGDPGGPLLALYELQKLLYELRYELSSRPDWVGIPAAGIARLLESWWE